jgi:hypothetical protein
MISHFLHPLHLFRHTRVIYWTQGAEIPRWLSVRRRGRGNRGLRKKIRTECQDDPETSPDDTCASLRSREVRSVLCAPRPFPCVPSPGPRWGLVQKTGLGAVGFLGIIPRDDRAPAEWFRRGGDPVLPKNKKRTATEEKGALGSTAFFHYYYRVTGAKRSGNPKILSRAGRPESSRWHCGGCSNAKTLTRPSARSPSPGGRGDSPSFPRGPWERVESGIGVVLTKPDANR